MFLYHIAFSVGLLAFMASVAMFVWSLRAVGAGVSFTKVVGFIVMIIALISVICTGYCGMLVWKAWKDNGMMYHGVMLDKASTDGTMSNDVVKSDANKDTVIKKKVKTKNS